MAKNSEFKIEKGVPIPHSRARFVLPLESMKPGDSFFCECDGDRERKRQSIWQTAKYHNLKIVTRSEGNGLRIWRIE